MKNLRIFVAISLLLAAGCNRPEAEDPVTPEKPKGKYELKELTATLPEADTKTDLDLTSCVVKWSDNDRIVVVGTDGEMHQYVLESGAGSPVGRFKYLNSKATYTNPSDLTAIYPACAVASANSSTATIRINSDRSSDYENYGITSWNNDRQYDFRYNDIKVAKPSSGTETDQGLYFKFTQLGTWCRFMFDFTQSPDFDTDYSMGETMRGMTITTMGGDLISGTATLNLSDLSMSSGNETSVNWDFSSSSQLDAQRVKGIMMFPSVSTSSTLHITLRTDRYAFEFYGSPNMDFSAGSVLKFPITVDKNFKENTGDLYYTKTTKNTRAPFYYYGDQNCYLLATTATGAQTINATPYRTDVFYHRSNNSGAGAPPGAGAKLLWQDDNGLITSVSYNATNKTISYTRESGHYGNALIALTDEADGAGNILWSYHIWCPEDAPKDLTYTISMNGENKTLMSMPLGATKDIHTKTTNAGGTADGYGLYYQWGRKDPLGRVADTNINSTIERDYWDASGTPITPFGSGQSVPYTTIIEGYTGSVADETNAAYQPKSQFMQNYARKNPTTFIIKGAGIENNNWCGETNNYLWGNYRTAGSFPRMSQTYKSIFDPCPAGYRVPPEDTWVGFTTTKQRSTDSKTWNMANNGTYTNGKFEGIINNDETYKYSVAHGYAFCYAGYASVNTDFYPASGIRNLKEGNVGFNSYDGRCWTSVTDGEGARGLTIRASEIITRDYHGRSAGICIRCVKESTQ